MLLRIARAIDEDVSQSPTRDPKDKQKEDAPQISRPEVESDRRSSYVTRVLEPPSDEK
jgi:hypothetical protein